MGSPDYEEFIAAFNAHSVRYLIVGAHAVALHARPRATKDLDILVQPTAVNARNVLAALNDFFGSETGYTASDLTDPKYIIQLGVAPVRIDLMADLSGCPSFDAAWKRRVEAAFGAVRTHYLGLDDLIHAKEAADRPQDRADLVALRKAKARARRARR